MYSRSPPRAAPHLAPDLIGIAVRFAGMIGECSPPVSVNDAFAAIQAEQIRARKIVVKIVGLFVGKVLAHVFHDQRPFANRPRGVATVGVNARLAKDKSHGASSIFSTRGTGSCKCQVSQLSVWDFTT